MKEKVTKISLLISSIIVCLLFSEIILRLYSDNQFYIWPPNLKQYFLPKQSIFPGIKDTSFFKVNSFGFRGNEKGDSNTINIVTIGGSTTECLYLNQNETWPALLEYYLNQNSEKRYKVFNGGRSGLNSSHHLIQLQKLLENEKWIDIIIILEGINDLQYALSLCDHYEKKSPQEIYNEAFLISPLNDNLPVYKRSYLYMRLSKLEKSLFSYKMAQDAYGYSYIQWRKNRASATKIIDSIPNLNNSVSDYYNNNNSIISLVKSKHKNIIFLTQPVMWKENMTIALNKLCWFGWIGKDQNENTGIYYSFPMLKIFMDNYNSQLKAVCSENNIDCIDLDNILEKDVTSFYDDCHFNERGASKVAKIIYLFMSANK